MTFEEHLQGVGCAERRSRAGPVHLLLVGMPAISQRRTEIRRFAFLATHILELLAGTRPRAAQDRAMVGYG